MRAHNYEHVFRQRETGDESFLRGHGALNHDRVTKIYVRSYARYTWYIYGAREKNNINER